MSQDHHLHMERKILKWGNSYAIRIPKEFIEKLGINPETDKIFMDSVNDSEIKITKEKPRYRTDSIQHLFKDYDAEPFQEEILNPIESVGDEEW